MRLDDNTDILESLPPGSALYTRTGVASLLRRVATGDSALAAESWLHIPQASLAAVVAEDSGGDPTEQASSPTTIDLDGRHGFPIVREGVVQAVLVYEDDSLVALSNGQLNEIADQIATEKWNRLNDERMFAKQFVGMLYQRDHSVDTFLQGVIKLLTEVWEDSYGAVYNMRDGVYSVRLAGGNLDYCHHLSTHINHVMATRVEQCLDSGEHFMTADPLPDRPVFLEQVPDLLFIYPGMSRDGHRQIIVIAGGGDISLRTSTALDQLADLVSGVSAGQFATARDVMKLYAKVSAEPPEAFNVDDLLLTIFETLVPQIRLSRMVVTVVARGQASGMSQVITPASIASKRVDLVSDISHPDNILQTVLSGHPFHLTNMSDRSLSERQVRQRYLANVKSELYLPVWTGGEVRAVVAFGSSEQGEYLTDMQHVLEAVTSLLGLALALTQSHLSEPAGRAQAIKSPTEDITGIGRRSSRSGSRLGIVRKLARGYLHDMLSLLSVVIGSAEVTAQAVNADGALMSSTSQRLKMGLSRIDAAADRLSQHVSTVSRLLSMADNAAGVEIQLSTFVKELPALFYGLIKQCRDTRDLQFQIKVTAATGGEISVQTTDLYDHVLAFIAEVLDRAQESGQIDVSLASRKEQNVLTIACEKSLFGTNNPGRLVESVFARSTIDWDTPHSGSFNAGSFKVSFGREDNGSFSISLAWPQRSAAGSALSSQANPARSPQRVSS